MNLPFMTKFPKDAGKLAGKETEFIDKIWLGLNLEKLSNYSEYEKYMIKGELEIVSDAYMKPKLHTIRQDKSDRWKVGNDIHFFINSRTPNQFQFAPVIGVIGIQRIEIVQVANVKTPYTYKTIKNKMMQIIVDGNCLSEKEMKGISINDGFDSVEDFFEYFNKDFSGKIIQWTNLKY